MKQRIITGSILVAILIPVLVFSHTPVFAGVVTLLAVIGTWEMLHCIGTNKKPTAVVPSLIYSVLVCSVAKVFMSVDLSAVQTQIAKLN